MGVEIWARPQEYENRIRVLVHVYGSADVIWTTKKYCLILFSQMTTTSRSYMLE